jgi:hypothetical protein
MRTLFDRKRSELGSSHAAIFDVPHELPQILFLASLDVHHGCKVSGTIR